MQSHRGDAQHARARERARARRAPALRSVLYRKELLEDLAPWFEMALYTQQTQPRQKHTCTVHDASRSAVSQT